MARLPAATLFGVLAVWCGLAAPTAAQEAGEAFYELGPIEVLGDAPSYLQLGVGAFDVFRESVRGVEADRSAAAQIELRLGEKLYFVGPAIGILANTDGGVYGYGGLYADLALGDLVVTPLGAIGGYARGDSKDLGGVFQFRASVTAAYAFPGGSRLGVQLGHISNAGIHEVNPSEEDVMLTYGVPF